MRIVVRAGGVLIKVPGTKCLLNTGALHVAQIITQFCSWVWFLPFYKQYRGGLERCNAFFLQEHISHKWRYQVLDHVFGLQNHIHFLVPQRQYTTINHKTSVTNTQRYSFLLPSQWVSWEVLLIWTRLCWLGLSSFLGHWSVVGMAGAGLFWMVATGKITPITVWPVSLQGANLGLFSGCGRGHPGM